MAKGAEAGPKLSGGGGGGSAVEKAQRAVESVFSVGEWGAHVVLPPFESLSYLFAGKGWSVGAIHGIALAVGISFVYEMIRGTLSKLGGGGH